MVGSAASRKESTTTTASVDGGAASVSSILSSSSEDKKKRIPSSMATDDHQPFKMLKTPSSSNKDKKKRIPSPMSTDDHQPFKTPKIPLSSSKDKTKRISSSMATDDHRPFKTPKTPSSSNKDKKKRIPSPMATDDHQPFKTPKRQSSSSKDKKKRISSSMATDDDQPFKTLKTPSSSNKDKKKRIPSPMSTDDHQPFKRPKIPLSSSKDKTKRISSSMATDDHRPFKTLKTPSSSNKDKKKRIPGPMATDDHQPFKTPKTPSSSSKDKISAPLSSSKDKKKRISGSMATDDHQPFKTLKIPSSSSKDKKKRISGSMATDDRQPFKTLKTPLSSSKDKKKRISGSMAADDRQPFKRLKAPSPSTATPTPSTAWGRLGELPNDVLSIVLQKLILQDQLRLSCVCVPSYLAVRGGGVGHRPSPKPQLPWLMIAGGGRDHTSAKFISLSEHRTYDIPLPHPPIRKRLCIGSSHGWLITLYKLSEMHLLNPITGVQVPLPPITTTVPAATTFPSMNIITGDAFFGKAILSSAPSRDGTGDFTIFLIRGKPNSNFRTLAIARIGDGAWTTFADEHIFDIMYHKGQLLIMGSQGYIHIWEHHLYTVPRFVIDTKDFLHSKIPFGSKRDIIVYPWTNHFVQSMTGELFVVSRIRFITRDTEEIKLKVVRLDLDRKEYVPMYDLKDLVFFVGISDSIVVSATKSPEVKRNCVYYALHYFVSREIRVMKNISVQSIGVFDVDKEEITELLDNIGSHLSSEEKKHIGSLMNCASPTWITPTLF